MIYNLFQPKAGGDSPAENAALVLGDMCGSSYTKWSLTPDGGIKHDSSGMCWNPLSDSTSPKNGNQVILKSTCGGDSQQFSWNGKPGGWCVGILMGI